MLDLVGNPEDRFSPNEAHLFPDSALVTSLRAFGRAIFLRQRSIVTETIAKYLRSHTAKKSDKETLL